MGISREFEGHDPLARLDYTIKWSRWLDNDQITGSSWSAEDDNPSGMFIDSQTFTTGTATIWLTSGTAYRTYAFDNLIGTLQGRRVSEKIYVTVKDK